MDTKFIIWQVNIWDKFAKLSPIIVIIALIVLYLLGYRDWILIYSIGAVFFVTVAVTWWFWVIYSIASIAIVLHRSGTNIQDIINEIKELRKIIKDKDY